MPPTIKPIPFGERPGSEPYNASEVVALGDSRFLFCDNNVSDAFFEFRLARDGTLAGGIIRRPIDGLEPGVIDDIEGIEIVEIAGRKYIFGTSSLSRKVRKRRHKKKRKRGKAVASRSSIIRVEVGNDRRLRAEVIRDFRPWLIDHAPWLKKAAKLLPDDAGLNVEALSWDPRKNAMMFGLRSPVINNRPAVVRVRPRKLDGPWTVENLTVVPPLFFGIPSKRGKAGIRAMSLDQATGISLLILGNSTSASKAPFALYSWDGNPRGGLHHYKDVRFHKRMKVEGVTRGTIHGRGALVFVDDAGGFQVVWNDDPRLARAVRVDSRPSR